MLHFVMEALPIPLILIDLHNPSIIHLATVVVPPVFAIAEAEHKSGKDMLAAVVAGYEGWRPRGRIRYP